MKPVKQYTIPLLLLMGTAVGVVAREQSESSFFEETSELHKTQYTVDPFGSQVFGDNLDLASGSVNFKHTDVSLPGNFDIEVSFSRVYHGTNLYRLNVAPLKDWMVDLPHIRTAVPWQGASSWSNGNECSGNPFPNIARGYFGDINSTTAYDFHPDSYWGGMTLHSFTGDQTLLLNNGTEQVLDDAPDGVLSPHTNSRYVTMDNWIVTCITRDNGNAEGFRATSPDGTTYTFDVPARYPGFIPFALVRQGIDSWRHEALYVSRIEDRFGNYVEYNYTAEGYIDEISASDGRFIDVHYSNGRINKVSTNGREWYYGYDNDSLSRVTLPDNSAWILNFSQINNEDIYREISYGCDGSPDAVQVSMTHPLGYRAIYDMNWIRHSRTSVPVEYYTSSSTSYTGNNPPTGPSSTRARIHGDCFAVFALKNKIVRNSQGADVYQWDYDYYDDVDLVRITDSSTVNVPLPQNIPGTSKIHYKALRIIDPKNTKRIFYVNREFDHFIDGKVVAEQVYDNSNILLQQIERTYQQSGFIGKVGKLRGSLTRQEYRVLKTNETIKMIHPDEESVDSSNYVTEYKDYNDFGHLLKVKRYNNFNDRVQFQKFDYYKNLTSQFLSGSTSPFKWILGLEGITQVSDSGTDSNYVTTREVTYHSQDAGNSGYRELALPYEVKRHGLLVKKYIEYQAGNVTNIEYNVARTSGTGNRSETFNDYKRGIPQIVTVPSRHGTGNNTFSRNVDDNGWITQETDLNGVITGYDYDPLGRLSLVDYSNDAIHGDWLDSVYTWSKDTSGNPIRTMHRCTWNNSLNSCNDDTAYTETETYDGLLRLNKVSQSDGITSRYQKFTYNSAHQQTFASFRSDNISESRGTHSHYDSLLRPIAISTSGRGTMTYQYLPANRVSVTDAQDNTTLNTYLAYGQPTLDQIITIESPEGVTTEFTINFLGLTESISQSGLNKQNNPVTSVEAFYYNNYWQLCLKVREDVGVTAYGSNALGELDWMAEGVQNTESYQSASPECISKPQDKAITYTLDNKGDIKQAQYPAVPDNNQTSIVNEYTPSLTMSYTRDGNGNLLTLSAGSTVHYYQYNNQNILESETLNIPGKNAELSLDYSYNGLMHRSALTYPDGSHVKYFPDAFGQVTEVTRYRPNPDVNNTATPYIQDTVYASSVRYYPNGVLNSFTYGNNITHVTSRHLTSWLPSQLTDYSDATSQNVMSLAYEYDNNLNITAITDHNNAWSLTSLKYDGLDRLTETIGNTAMGSATIRYDSLGNITRFNSKNRTLSYQYDATTHRLTSVDSTGSEQKDYSAFYYDDRGNVIHNGHRTFVYNAANQMVKSGSYQYWYDGHNRRVKQTDSKGTSYSMYSMDGTLLYRETQDGGINYIYLGNKLIAKDGFVPHGSGSQHYRPYGDSFEGAKDDVGYTGHKFDRDLGLSYMQARYYDPVIGRFYSNDPIGYRGVHSFNRYAYVNNNPYKYVDPTGMAEVFATNGQFVGIVNPQENNVYVQTDNGNQSLNTSINDFHRISSVVYGEGPAVGRTAEESTGIANVIANSGDRRGESMLESATGGRFHGDGNEAAQDYLSQWTQGGRAEAPAARAGVISVLSGQADPTNGSTMFEGTDLINSPLSHFRESYIETGVAHSPIVIGDTTFFQEQNP